MCFLPFSLSFSTLLFTYQYPDSSLTCYEQLRGTVTDVGEGFSRGPGAPLGMCNLGRGPGGIQVMKEMGKQDGGLGRDPSRARDFTRSHLLARPLWGVPCRCVGLLCTVPGPMEFADAMRHLEVSELLPHLHSFEPESSTHRPAGWGRRCSQLHAPTACSPRYGLKPSAALGGSISFRASLRGARRGWDLGLASQQHCVALLA